MAFSIFGEADVQKLLKKHRIAARMISELINDRDNWKGDALAFKERFFNARANFDTLTKEYNALVMKSNKAEKERDALKNTLETLDTITLQDRQRISELEKEILDLKNVNSKNINLRIHAEGKIAAYEKILKIEK